ncbi:MULTISPECIES: anhydro-N-acetylmuramic acid kinase [unclassified Marinobacter]|uniref:anhydro-N-acetylmuramic acid kinase n=1 Tax=unclassified Marinobacter TaxID=83889 RepID=UPI0026E2CEBF|nr:MULTISPECIES: anhydro-N-acetylmuramic acid kinase [unclassified Marinobacter]MDO6444107.1 anhydro-N-acetylmuramic acid kinase [Marinobacter sp. 2_MG-2023]MDO6823982.1 anhydro-N-acetylmuramic acid kinase [Marinobacter sp. 1_MG-2023]
MDTWIGLMSGTSMDGIDAVLVSFQGETVHIHETHSTPYPEELRQRLVLASQNHATPDEVGELDTLTGVLFAETAEHLIHKSNLDKSSIRAIGSHGQTLRHQPSGPGRFSLQIGNAAIIAERTGITTVGDFRSRDMAAGGQGAPLVPAFHQHFFGSETEDRCILNLGGIANITWIPSTPGTPVTGFDTGPANALMDAWCQDQTGRPFDADGHWAQEGIVDQALLTDMLSDAYFDRPAPKSTGKEKFNIEWVKTQVKRHEETRPEDVQRTLLQLTVITAIRQMPQSPAMTVYACGGGTRNRLLMRELSQALSPIRILDTAELGLDPQWVEPTAFAWLARQTMKRKPGNLAEVTGAKGPRILGAIYPA